MLAPGTDGVTWQAYGENLEEKLKDLHERVHRGSYRARPASRTYIPKADGSKRPLSLVAMSHSPPQALTRTLHIGRQSAALSRLLSQLSALAQKPFVLLRFLR
jgi:hypothetical protein